MTRPVPEPLVCTTYRPPCAVLLEASAIGDVRVPDSASKAIVCAVGADVVVTTALVEVGGVVVPRRTPSR